MIDDILIKKIVLWVAQFLLFLMIALPFEFIYVKVLLILLIIGFSLLDNVTIQLFTAKWFGFLVLWGMGFILLGVLYETEGAFPLIGVYIIWPLIYFFFIVNIKSIEVFYKLVQTALVSSVFISGYLIIYVFSLRSSFIDPELFTMAREVAGDSSRVEVFVPSATSLLFIVPLNIALLISSSKPIFSKKYLLIILLFNMASVYILHRNMLYLSVVLSPIISIVLYKFITKKYFMYKIHKILHIKYVAFLIVLSFLLVVFSNELLAIIKAILYGFEFTSEDAISAHTRYLQFFELIEGWKSKPFFGNGLGATLDSSSFFSDRSKTPWMFELSYIALLYNVGIVGLFFYFSIIITMIRKSILVARSDINYHYIVVAVLTATISFMIGNSTNPYLYAYDHMWAFFAPLGVINSYLYAKNRGIYAQ